MAARYRFQTLAHYTGLRKKSYGCDTKPGLGETDTVSKRNHRFKSNFEKLSSDILLQICGGLSNISK